LTPVLILLLAAWQRYFRLISAPLATAEDMCVHLSQAMHKDFVCTRVETLRVRLS